MEGLQLQHRRTAPTGPGSSGEPTDPGTDFPTDFPTDLPSPTGSFCITPQRVDADLHPAVATLVGNHHRGSIEVHAPFGVDHVSEDEMTNHPGPGYHHPPNPGAQPPPPGGPWQAGPAAIRCTTRSAELRCSGCAVRTTTRSAAPTDHQPVSPPYGPPAGQAQYGPPWSGPGEAGAPAGPGGPGGPSGPRRRNPAPWIISGVVVVVGALALVLVLSLGGGKPSSDAKGTVDKLLQAAQHKDLKTAQSLTCDPLNKQLVASPLVAVTKYELGDAQESGDSATVAITATVLGKEKNYTADAQKQGGSWKVCNLAEGGSGATDGGDGQSTTLRPTAFLGPKQTLEQLLQGGKQERPTDRVESDLRLVAQSDRQGEVPARNELHRGEAKVDGKTATVPFGEVIDGKGSDSVAELEMQQNGTWKVCDF